MNRLRVLVACECSQVVQQAFSAAGHWAWSLDIQPAYGPDPSHHIIADAYDFSLEGWDLIIAHPPCTLLSRIANGLRGRPGRGVNEVLHALRLWARFYLEAPCPVAVENPVGAINSIHRPTQIIQPYYFGDPYQKETCLWLRGLPPLFSTVECVARRPWVGGGKSNGVADKVLGVTRKFRARARSQTFPGIAAAMAKQWGEYLTGRASSPGSPAEAARPVKVS